MAIEAHCPTCQTVYELADQMVGKYVVCQKCKQRFKVPLKSRTFDLADDRIDWSSDPALEPEPEFDEPLPFKPVDSPEDLPREPRRKLPPKKRRRADATGESPPEKRWAASDWMAALVVVLACVVIGLFGAILFTVLQMGKDV